MENNVEKKNTGLVVLVVVLSLLVLGLGGYIVYDKTLSDDSETNLINDNIHKDTDENQQNITIWTDYILSQQINSIQIVRTPLEGERKNTTITTSQLNEIFSKISDKKIIKKYSGGWGFADGDEIVISYSTNNVNYKLLIANGHIDESLEDSQLLSVLESNVSSISGEEWKNQDGATYHFIIDNFDNSILDSYFN